MSDSPIFDQLIEEFAAKGAVYEEFIRFITPEFEWDPNRPVVQLDKKPKTGVKFAKTPARGIEIHSFAKETLEESQKKASTDFGRLIQDYVAQVGQSFAERHPLAMVTDMHTEVNDDNSATLVIEAVQPITSVMPLSERNSA